MKFSRELSDRDLSFFRDALQKSRNAIRHAEESEIIEAVADVLAEIKSEKPLPDFVIKRIPQLESMLQMLQDDEWILPADERERLLAAFVYFADPEDIVPDDIPVIGYLDDIIMIELVVRELLHVREAYDDFCEYRATLDKESDYEADSVLRRDRIDKKRQQLQQRMKRRFNRDKRAKKELALW